MFQMAPHTASMGAISVFNINDGKCTKLLHQAFFKEKELQKLVENNLDNMLGIQFLASEFPTSTGRIDTIGIDENNVPVIIEYKRNRNDSVILQALFYLDWLMSHKNDFRYLLESKIGKIIEVNWEKPRIICIAESFSPYDIAAINQIKRDVQLLQYHKLAGELIVLESLNTDASIFDRQSYEFAVGEREAIIVPDVKPNNLDDLSRSEKHIREIFSDLEERIFQLGTDVNRKPVKTYIAYRKVKNFAAVQINVRSLAVYLKIDPKTVQLEEGFSSDMSTTGHIATGDLELVLRTSEDVERAMPLIARSYDENL